MLTQQIAKVDPLCELIESLSDKITNARTDLDQCKEKINNFMEWQDTDEASTAPKILESHKEILFIEWQSQLMKAEREISKCKLTTSNLVELVNDTLYLSNTITQCTPGKITPAKSLELSCYPELERTGRLIVGINSLTWDTYWLFLIKPYSQRAALKCLTDAIKSIVPEIQDATYVAQLSSRLSRPPEVEPILTMCQIKSKGKQHS